MTAQEKSPASAQRNRSIDVLDVLEEWIMINGKPKRIMHDNGKQFTSNIFKRFLEHNNIKDNPQLQGKVEACLIIHELFST
jgi:transposase InsO family protein